MLLSPQSSALVTRMAQQRQLVIADQRAVTPRLLWLTLHAPDLAGSARAGQYLLIRCAEPGSYDPLLRRPLYLAAAEPALGQIGLLYAPDERGLAWLARSRAGDKLDVLGPFGQPFVLDPRTRNLLLIGSGPGLPALLLLAHTATIQRCAVTLLAGAEADELLPPPFLLPAEAEYQTVAGPALRLLASPQAGGADTPPSRPAGAAHAKRGKASQAPALPVALSPIAWADQLCAALPQQQLTALGEMVRAVKYRWERGFASALLEGPLVCGVGACGVCAIELRRGARMLCNDGPVFDMLAL